jgi:hypothetical protein
MNPKTYKLTDDEISDIVERELPQENFFQDGELTLKEALKNLVCLIDNRRISRITFDYYMEGLLDEK